MAVEKWDSDSLYSLKTTFFALIVLFLKSFIPTLEIYNKSNLEFKKNNASNIGLKNCNMSNFELKIYNASVFELKILNMSDFELKKKTQRIRFSNNKDTMCQVSY